MAGMPNRRALLLTIDADWMPGSEGGLELLLDLADRLAVRATIFTTGKFALDNPALIRTAHRGGHEIGNHGWEHILDWTENYRFTDYRYQRERLERSTEVIASLTGTQPRAFRAPFLWISEDLARVLCDLDYRVDSSVPARRYDGGFGMVDSVGHFTAPVVPYRTDARNLARRGSGPIVEVAPSAFFLPVVMSSIRRLGLAATLLTSRLVRLTSPVLNFYCHPWEFVEPQKRRFPEVAPERYKKNTGPEWIGRLEAFLRRLLSWGYGPATISEVARQAESVPRAGGLKDEIATHE